MPASSSNLPNLPIGLMVLVVDDDEAIANLWQAVLWNVPGLFATTASDGEEAVELARELQPDVILMDLMMPGTDGVAATRRLKSDPLTSQIPVVAVTGASYASQTAIDAGCDDYMVKPLSEAQLVEGIRRVLRIRDS
jgi:CheY-like chemotaxis protein